MDKIKLLFTGTDSLAYEIKTKYFNKNVNPDIEKRFHTSDYPTNHPSGIIIIIIILLSFIIIKTFIGHTKQVQRTEDSRA